MISDFHFVTPAVVSSGGSINAVLLCTVGAGDRVEFKIIGPPGSVASVFPTSIVVNAGFTSLVQALTITASAGLCYVVATLQREYGTAAACVTVTAALAVAAG